MKVSGPWHSLNIPVSRSNCNKFDFKLINENLIFFCASSESENRFYGLFDSINTPRLCRDFTNYVISNDSYVFHRRSRNKGSIISKIHTIYFNTKHSSVISFLFCLFEDDFQKSRKMRFFKNCVKHLPYAKFQMFGNF